MTHDTKVHGQRYDTGPTLGVTVGELRGGWNDGVFAGDDELVQWARRSADAHVETRLFGMTLTADADTIKGALAALGSHNPGRAIITEAPAPLLAEVARETLMIDPDPDDEDAAASGDGGA